MATLNLSSCNYQILPGITKVIWATYSFMGADNPTISLTFFLDVSIFSTLFFMAYICAACHKEGEDHPYCKSYNCVAPKKGKGENFP